MEQAWPFADPPNVAVFTLRRILSGESPIRRVCRDAEDGSWQFLDGDVVIVADAMLVALKTVLAHDSSIADLADLPVGWEAYRKQPGEPWVMGPRAPSPGG